jgi:hypothetical protein
MKKASEARSDSTKKKRTKKMSQVYQVRLEGNVTRSIHVNDCMTHRVELTDILTTEEMKTTLKQELLKSGWKQEGDTTFVKVEDGENLVWDLESGEVKAKIGKEKQVSIDVDVVGSSGSKRNAHENAERALAHKKEEAQGTIDEMQQKELEKVANQLQSNEKERVKKINGVLSRVYTQAIKQKAGQLGSITSVEEGQSGDIQQVLIRVEA